MAKNEEPKMTLEEYEQKYSKPENLKAARTFLILFTACIGIIVAFCLFSVVMKVYEMNEYAGYAAIAIAVLIFIFVYLVPVVKLSRTKAFMTNVNATNAKEAQKYNRKLREEIADKMIEVSTKTNVISWYSSERIGRLAIARHTNNNDETKQVLTEIYDQDVRSAANKMIREHSLKVGFITALSQSEKIDTLFVCTYDLKLIKDIVFLYGYRPSDAKLAKIYKEVIGAAIIAYGFSGNIGTGVANLVGKATKGIPVLGSAIGTVVDSATQGVINASLTALIGFQTKKYLVKEYKLQDMLDNIDLSEETEDKEQALMLDSIKEDLSKKNKDKTPDVVAA